MKSDHTPTDERLIESFLANGPDEAESAFELLVERYGPMVLRTCRQIVKVHEDAEDAFQATFLTLARKAATIQKREALGPWLHAVACRVATRIQLQAARRPWQASRTAEKVTPGESESRVEREELRQALRAEIDRLPERYRSLVVHCYMEGKTNDEAARIVGCPVGTVKGHLFRARGILRERLRDRDDLRMDLVAPARR